MEQAIGWVKSTSKQFIEENVCNVDLVLVAVRFATYVTQC